MFGGTGFLLGGNIFVGTSKQGLLVRVGKEAHHQAVRQTGVKAMTMGGRVSQGFVFVDPKVLDAPALKSWVSSAVEFVKRLPRKPAKKKSKHSNRKKS